MNLGAGGIFNIGNRNGVMIHARVGGPITDYLGLEATLGTLVYPGYSAVLQGSLVAHLVPDRWSQNKLVPFVTAGAGLGLPFPFLMVSYGGGAKYHFTRHLGLRFDVRDNMLRALESRGLRHTLEVSGGLTIRF